jgi:uncharacterized protein YqgC (DUF456 family)
MIPVFLVKIFAVLCMLLGLIGTFIHKWPGTPLIFLAALIYALFKGFSTPDITWIVILLVLSLVAELGSRLLRDWLMPQVAVDKVFGLDVAAGSFASLVITDVLAGPVLGLILWELLIGKSLMPVIKRSGMLVLKLYVAATFRFSVAVSMIIIIAFKVL